MNYLTQNQEPEIDKSKLIIRGLWGGAIGGLMWGRMGVITGAASWTIAPLIIPEMGGMIDNVLEWIQSFGKKKE